MILSNNKFEHIISWLPHGRSWRIINQKAFEEQVIPLYFRTLRFSTFTRQVCGWGFTRITAGADYNSYYQELFLRGMPHLCQKMKRLTAKDMAERKKLKEAGMGMSNGCLLAFVASVECLSNVVVRFTVVFAVQKIPDFYRMDKQKPLPLNDSVAPEPPSFGAVPPMIASAFASGRDVSATPSDAGANTPTTTHYQGPSMSAAASTTALGNMNNNPLQFLQNQIAGRINALSNGSAAAAPMPPVQSVPAPPAPQQPNLQQQLLALLASNMVTNSNNNNCNQNNPPAVPPAPTSISSSFSPPQAPVAAPAIPNLAGLNPQLIAQLLLAAQQEQQRQQEEQRRQQEQQQQQAQQALAALLQAMQQQQPQQQRSQDNSKNPPN